MASRGSGSEMATTTPAMFHQCRDRYETCNQQLGVSIASILSLSKHIAESDSYSGDKKADLLKLQKCVEALACLDAESKARGSICASLRQALVREATNNTDPVNELDTYRTELAVKKAQWTGENPKAVRDSREVADMRAIVRSVVSDSGEQDDDIVVRPSAQDAPQRCPITGKDLERPVVCKPCGHVYSTEGVIGLLIQQNSRGRRRAEDVTSIEQLDPQWSAGCPQAGCKVRVSSGVLERDYRTEASQKNAQRRAGARRDNDDASDAEDVDFVEV